MKYYFHCSECGEQFIIDHNDNVNNTASVYYCPNCKHEIEDGGLMNI